MLICSSVELKVTPEEEQEPQDTGFIAVYERAKMLDHPNIIAVLDYGIDQDGKRFVVEQDVSGVPLSSVLCTRGALNAVTTTAVFTQIVDALEYAAAEGVWIGDLCPDRILVSGLETGAPIIKIAGIGTCDNAFEKDISARSLIANENATPYASPERCLGKPTDERSIIYAIGCMLYEATYGKRAFEETDQIKLLFDHVNAEALRIPGFTRPGFSRFDSIVRKCLHSDPGQRFKDLSTLRHQLENLEKPIKFESEATKAQVVAMHLSGARTPVGAELFCLSFVVLVILFTNVALNAYARQCTTLQRTAEEATMIPFDVDPDKMINRWKTIRHDGFVLGQPRQFEADCDMNIANWMTAKSDMPGAFDYYKKAANHYRFSGMPASELDALETAMSLYRTQACTITANARDGSNINHAEEIIPLGHRKVSILSHMWPSDPLQTKNAMIDLADIYMSKKQWTIAGYYLHEAQRKYSITGEVDSYLCWKLGMCEHHEGRATQAEHWYRTAMSALETDPWQQGEVVRDLTELLRQQGKLGAREPLPLSGRFQYQVIQ